MKSFQQNGINYLAVEVPEGASEFEILYHTNILTHKEGGVDLWYGLPPDMGDLKSLPHGEYSIIGLLPEITEERAKEMVDDCAYFAKCWHKYDADHESGCPEDDFNSKYSCWTAIESIKSRLRQLGFETDNILIIKQLQ